MRATSAVNGHGLWQPTLTLLEWQATHNQSKSIEASVIGFRRKDLDTIATDVLYKTIRAND